jgi:sugar lactone lactonase YvrE
MNREGEAMIRSIGSARCVWNARAILGEGPVWSAAERAVWFVDIKQKKIHCFNTESQQDRSWSVPEQPGFVVPIDECSFVVGLKSGLHRFNATSGTCDLWRVVEPTQPSNRLNDAHVDARGRLWFGSMDDAERELSGALYRFDVHVDIRDALSCHERGICITNGPCTSPDGRTFYHTDTVNRVTHTYDLNDDGSLSNKRIFTQFELAEGHPDGSVVDSEGCIWTAMWGGSCVLRLSPRGERIGKVELPCAHVTKAGFGGSELKTMYITTARKGLTEAQLVEQPLAGGLFAIDVDVAGLPQNRIKLGS